MLDLACIDQIFHSACDILDRHSRIDAVLVEQVDAVGPETPDKLIFFELKKKALTRRARAGMDADLLLDLAGSTH